MANVEYFNNPAALELSGDEYQALIDAFLAGLPAGTKIETVSVGSGVLIFYGEGVEGIAGGLARTEVNDADYDVADGDVAVVFIALTAARAVNLPAVADAGDGRTIIVIDESGAAGTYAISVTPDGSEEIDGVAAAVDVAVNYGFLTLYCTGTAWKTLGYRIA